MAEPGFSKHVNWRLKSIGTRLRTTDGTKEGGLVLLVSQAFGNKTKIGLT